MAIDEYPTLKSAYISVLHTPQEPSPSIRMVHSGQQEPQGSVQRSSSSKLNTSPCDCNLSLKTGLWIKVLEAGSICIKLMEKLTT